MKRIGEPRACSVRALMVFVALLGCGRDPASQQAPTEPPSRFAMFATPRVSVSRLETPTQLPMMVGSVSAPDLVISEDPAIATIDGAGKLLAHRNGTVRLRGVRSWSQCSR
jgi:hypothetical protein